MLSAWRDGLVKSYKGLQNYESFGVLLLVLTTCEFGTVSWDAPYLP